MTTTMYAPGASTILTLPVPTPGISNQSPLPPAYTALLNNLRITEVMYQPDAPSGGSSDYEFIELQNIGSTTLDLSGVRFTNGLEYDFAAGTMYAFDGSPAAHLIQSAGLMPHLRVVDNYAHLQQADTTFLNAPGMI